MSNIANPGCVCCASPVRDLTKLTFLDGSQVGIIGLQGALAAIYAEGWQANDDTAEEITNRLEEKNYIPDSARQEYQRLFLNEYKKFVAARKNKTA